MPSDFVPHDSPWQPLYDRWLPSLRLTRLVTEPEGSRSQIDEIITQSMTWAYWWDEVEQIIQYDVVRPVDVDETVATFNDDDNLLGDSMEPKDEPDELLNQIYYAIGPREPAQPADSIRLAKVVTDAAAITSVADLRETIAKRKGELDYYLKTETYSQTEADTLLAAKVNTADDVAPLDGSETWHVADVQSVAGSSYVTIFDLTGPVEMVSGNINGAFAGWRLTVDGAVVRNRTTNANGHDSTAIDSMGSADMPRVKAATSLKLEAYNTSGSSRAIGWEVATR